MIFREQLDHYVNSIEAALPGFLPDNQSAQRSVVDAMSYALTGGGKRVRGVLVLALYRMLRDSEEALAEAMPFAGAIEMIHAYSLIHDDLPCMDDDDMRRGRPACHIAFGEAIALLAGDGLLTLAFETAAAPKNRETFDAATLLDAMSALAKAAGTGGMIGGQVVDLESEGKAVPVETLREMDRMKTGALMEAAVRMGCILGGAGEDITGLAVRYAQDVGLAFQIVDDILDQTGSAEELGKPIGSDAGNEKSTYTALYGLEQAAQIAQDLSASAKEAIRATGLDAVFLCELADYLLQRRH